MTPDQVASVRRTFKLIEPIQEQTAVLFYRRLFELDPAIAARLTGTDSTLRRTSLTRALTVVADGLDPRNRPEVVALAQFPVALGIRSEDHAIASAALVTALKDGLGPAFTPDVGDAWGAALGILTGPPIDGPGIRRPRRPAASSSRASDTRRSTPPARPA